MGRSRPTDKAKTAKKGAAPGLSRHFSEEQLAPLKAKSARARRAKPDEQLRLDTFKRRVFLATKDKEEIKKQKAVVDAAIADGRLAGITESAELMTHVFGKTGFLRKQRGKSVGATLNEYVRSQCAEEDISTRKKPWWNEVVNLAKATKAQLVFVERDGEGNAVAAYSCQNKQVYYPADSGLTTKRGSIGFSVEKLGEGPATQFALEESQSALGLLRKFEKQIKKLRSSAQKPKLDAPSPRDVASRFADDVCSTTLPHAGRRRCGKTSPSARRRAAPSRASRAARRRTSTRVSSAWRSAAIRFSACSTGRGGR